MILPCKVCKIPEFRDTGTYGVSLGRLIRVGTRVHGEA